MISYSRGRLAGAVLLLTVFAAGVVAGYAVGRRPRPGVEINIRTRSALPKELTELGLSAAQRDTMGALMFAGRLRATTILRELEPRMREAMDSLDRQIHEALTPDQRARLDAARKARGEIAGGRLRDTSEVVIDSEGGKRSR